MIYKLVIPGTLPNMNECLDAAKFDPTYYGKGKGKNRPRPGMMYEGLKKKAIRKVADQALAQLGKTVIEGRCMAALCWYTPNRRLDPGNIAFGEKFIFDGLQENGNLPNDGWANLGGGFIHQFRVDKNFPRVEVYIIPGRQIGFDPEKFS